MNTFSGGQAFS